MRVDNGVAIEADAAAAYPPSASLTRFRRTFRFSPPGTFTVTDDVELAQARKVEWHLQSDTAPRERGRAWLLGSDDVALRVETKLPPGVRFTSGPTFLMAPGRPGSITSGTKDQRGYRLLLESPAAQGHRFEVALTVEAGK